MEDETEPETNIYREETAEDDMEGYMANFPNLPATNLNMETAGPSVDKEKDIPQFIAAVAVPSQKEVEEALIRRKKMELLEKYASESLLQQCQQARTLMGYETAEETVVVEKPMEH